jgi:hypothetical protein
LCKPEKKTVEARDVEEGGNGAHRGEDDDEGIYIV